MGSVKIAPSILSADFAALGAAMAEAEAGGADWHHVDVMDGHFVPNITIGPPVVAKLAKVANIPLDTHLMISDADKYLQAFVDAGADRVLVHFEACTHLHRTLVAIRDAGAAAGVVLNPHTPAESVSHVLDVLDQVLLMSVNPGFGGQSFIPQVIPKIARMRQLIGERDIIIEVDGGVTPDNAAEVVAAGADALVAGSAVYRGKLPTIAENIAAVRAAADEGLAQR